MRWSPLSIVLPFLLFTTSTIAHPVSGSTPSLSKIAKRTIACTTKNGRDLRKPPGRKATNNGDCREAGGNGFTWSNVDTLAPIGVLPKGTDTTRTPFNARAALLDLKQQKVETKSASSIDLKTHNCDHILELDFVGRILRKQGGVCDQIAQAEAGDDREKELEAFKALDSIIVTLNDPENLAFLLSVVEGTKTDHTIEAKKIADNADKGIKTEFKDPPKPYPFIVMETYLDATRTRSIAVAERIDTIITTNFGGSTATVKVDWEEYLATAKRQSEAATKILTKLKNTFDECTPTVPGASGSGSGSGSGPGRKKKKTIKVVPRMIDFVLGRRAQTKPAATCTPPKSATKPPPKKGTTKNGTTKNDTTKTPPTKKPPTKTPPTKKPPTKKPPTKKPPAKVKTPPNKKPPTKGKAPPKSGPKKTTKKVGGKS